MDGAVSLERRSRKHRLPRDSTRPPSRLTFPTRLPPRSAAIPGNGIGNHRRAIRRQTFILSNSTDQREPTRRQRRHTSTTDPDPGDTFAYAILDDPTGKFQIAGTTLRLLDGQSLNYETTPTVDLLLRTTDSGGHNFDKMFAINVVDLPETMSIDIGNWTAAGLTIKLDGGKLHAYQTGTTIDAVPPHNSANVLGIDVTGNDTSNVFTVDSLGSGIPLSVTNATLTIDRDNALFADTAVTLDGGVFNFGGFTSPMGNLTLIGNAQAQLPAVNNSITEVTSGTLTVGTILSDSLFIGTHSAAASTPIVSTSAPLDVAPTKMIDNPPAQAAAEKPVAVKLQTARALTASVTALPIETAVVAVSPAEVPPVQPAAAFAPNRFSPGTTGRGCDSAGNGCRFGRRVGRRGVT